MKWYKVVSMVLILLSIFIWKGFTKYISTLGDISIAEFVPPLLAIAVLQVLGIFFAARIEQVVMKYVLLLVHLFALGWAVFFIYQIFKTVGGLTNLFRQITY